MTSEAMGSLSGVWNIVPTPFDEAGEIDEASIGTLTEFVVRAGVDGITALGVMGEASRLSDEERTRVVGAFIERADGRLPVCVGVSHAATRTAVGFAREAEALGAAAVMLAPPPLARPNETAVRHHFLAMADAISVPIVVQDHPASSGVWMSVESLARLADEAPACRVVKLEDEPSPPKMARLLAANPRITVLGGLGAMMLIEELRRGAAGTMTGFGFPEILVEIVRAFRSGQEDTADSLFDRACSLIRFENQRGLDLAIRKLIYHRRGAIRTPLVRAPGSMPDDDTARDLDRLLARLIKSVPEVVGVASTLR